MTLNMMTKSMKFDIAPQKLGQDLHSRHLLHYEIPQIHILDEGLLLCPWAHRH